MPEKIGKYTEQPIKISDLELDTENPRTGVHPDQSSAINAMLLRKSTDIDEIAEGIVLNNFWTLEIPCVYPSAKKGKFVVAEGNRRITALKVLHTPDLARGSKKYSKFKELSQAARGKLPSEIKCAVFKNKKECEPYVLMRHGLGKDGASLKMWDPLERRRVAEATSGKRNQALNVIDFVLDHGDLAAKNELALPNIKITNLERIVNSSVVKEALRLNTSDKTVSKNGPDWLLPVWQRVLEVVVEERHQGNDFQVKNIYSTDDQKTFIDEILFEVHKIKIPVKGEPKATASSKEKDDKGKGKGTGTKAQPATTRNTPNKKKHKTTKQRKGLIDKDFSPPGLRPQKVINLVDELKKLPVADLPNCAGVMYRIFTELGHHNYMVKHKISKFRDDGKEHSEKEKKKLILRHLKASGLHDARIFKALEDTLSDAHPVSEQSLNYYVHSKTHSPEPETLKNAWDNVKHIYEILWEA